jgi:hypothetical protein
VRIAEVRTVSQTQITPTWTLRTNSCQHSTGEIIDGRRTHLHASRSKAAFVLLASIAFVAIGYFMRLEKPFIGWACMIFFGLGIPVGLIDAVLAELTYLRLDTEGFEMGSFVKKTRIKWTTSAASSSQPFAAPR